MPVIHSQLDPHSPQFLQNREAMLAGLAQIRQLEQNLLAKAAEAKAKFEKRGQLLPRERLNLLLDPGAPFLELASLAGYKLHDDKDGSQAGGGLIAGIGYVSGVRVLVVANNSAIKGGTISPSGLKKSLRLQQIAMENKLPVVTLAESGGANLNYAAEIFVEGARSFANQARMSAMGLPDHRGARLGHRRRRLPAGAVGLRSGGARQGQAVSCRPAPAQGRHRRGGHR